MNSEICLAGIGNAFSQQRAIVVCKICSESIYSTIEIFCKRVYTIVLFQKRVIWAHSICSSLRCWQWNHVIYLKLSKFRKWLLLSLKISTMDQKKLSFDNIYFPWVSFRIHQATAQNFNKLSGPCSFGWKAAAAEFQVWGYKIR